MNRAKCAPSVVKQYDCIKTPAQSAAILCTIAALFSALSFLPAVSAGSQYMRLYKDAPTYRRVKKTLDASIFGGFKNYFNIFLDLSNFYPLFWILLSEKGKPGQAISFSTSRGKEVRT